MRDRLTRLVPPGVDPLWELKWCLVVLGGCVLCSFGYLFDLAQARSDLFLMAGTQQILRSGAVMADFGQVLGKWLSGFLMAAVGGVLLAVWHYRYHRQGSMSIYLMRRLPDRWLLHRRCLALPALVVAAAVLVALALLLGYYALYLWVTPEGCLRLGQWNRLWAYVLGRLQ